MAGIVKVQMTTPPPEIVYVDGTYKIEGVATLDEKIGPPPWVYARVRKKDWYKPEIIEDTWYLRGFPIPIGGKVSMNWIPEEAGKYEVALVATPAPLALPVIGVPPITGESDTVSVTAEKVAVQISGLQITNYEAITGG